MDGWVNVGKIPLVSRNLPVGVHVPFPKKQEKLVFCEVGVDSRKWNHVECGVPGCEPGILPLVGHRENVAGVKVFPITISTVLP